MPQGSHQSERKSPELCYSLSENIFSKNNHYPDVHPDGDWRSNVPIQAEENQIRITRIMNKLRKIIINKFTKQEEGQSPYFSNNYEKNNRAVNKEGTLAKLLQFDQNLSN